MNQDNEDRFFKNLLEKSRVKMPFPDFEEEVMMQVSELESRHELISEGYKRGVAFSWVFFLIGTVCGIIISFLIPHFDFAFLGIDSGLFLLFFQVSFLLFILLHFEKLLILTRYKRPFKV